MDRDEFVDSYKLNDEEVQEFRWATEWLSINRFIGFALVLTVVSILVQVFAEGAGFPNYLNVDNFYGSAVLLAGLSMYLIFALVMSSKANGLGYLRTDIAAHYIAKGVEEFTSSDTDHELILEYFVEAVHYIDQNDLRIAHPTLEESFEDYITILGERNVTTTQLERHIEEGFSELIDPLLVSILFEEEHDSSTFVSQIEREYSQESQINFILSSFDDFLTNRRIQYGVPVVFLILAGIAWIASGPQTATLILTAFAVLQFVLSTRYGSE